ncbi:hypothetical protein BDV96DRAFT_571975 [Lophiotrema nucula]|uniref:Uncharacterized protein n=1 Tax=Lophiotrema nucula TaxID=690887 RepID=A0A6A5ZDR3_9PLEO|nr:hypothetical protein BDV96DRAFT_571975 [Lophiotrema nucula]
MFGIGVGAAMNLHALILYPSTLLSSLQGQTSKISMITALMASFHVHILQLLNSASSAFSFVTGLAVMYISWSILIRLVRKQPISDLRIWWLILLSSGLTGVGFFYLMYQTVLLPL